MTAYPAVALAALVAGACSVAKPTETDWITIWRLAGVSDTGIVSEVYADREGCERRQRALGFGACAPEALAPRTVRLR